MNLGILKLFSFFLVFFLVQSLFANTKSIDFDFIKKGKQDNNTLLIIGGIQGDEPGAFMAASLISTHYKITKGSVWVVPNLNFYSIIKRSRGPYGDMNRKFAKLSQSDPDYKAVQRIKKYIKSSEVKLILNLHDGSGFYRKKYENSFYSPNRWGQSSIIDQSALNINNYGNLEKISKSVCEYINKYLIRPRDYYKVKNTHTKLGDKEMEKTLTYYAINQGKAAFGNEASKNLPLHERTYYHLLALEKYMNIMGIKFKRNFKLTPKAVKSAIDNDIYMSFYGNKIQLPLSKIRKNLNYFPIKKDGTLDFKPSTPLMTVLKKNNSYIIHYGNRRIAKLKADYLDIDNSIKSVNLEVDGEKRRVKLGSIVEVKKSFLISPLEKFRVNIIGFIKKGRIDESGIRVSKNRILKRYSIDKGGKIFRVEFYNKKKFAGMILVNFAKRKNANKSFIVLSKQKSINSSL